MRFGITAAAAASSSACSVPAPPNEHTLAPRKLPAQRKRLRGLDCEGQVSSELGGWSGGGGPSLVSFEAWRAGFRALWESLLKAGARGPWGTIML